MYEKAKALSPPMAKSDNYQKLIDALLYVDVNTCPDIAASVSILSEHNQLPTEADWFEAKRSTKYLKETTNYQLRLDAEKGLSFKLFGYADADLAENRKYRKSNNGYIFYFCGAPITWAR